jgi:DNA-binding NtrC family response regulator
MALFAQQARMLGLFRLFRRIVRQERLHLSRISDPHSKFTVGSNCRNPSTVRFGMSSGHNCRRPTNILAVTPHLHDQVALAHALSHSNWRLVCLCSPAEAWRVLHEMPVSAVISELEYAGEMSWKELLEEVRVVSGETPLILAARCADERLWNEALNEGAFDLISKPFQSGEVLRAVGLAVRHFESTRPPARRTAAPSGPVTALEPRSAT